MKTLIAATLGALSTTPAVAQKATCADDLSATIQVVEKRGQQVKPAKDLPKGFAQLYYVSNDQKVVFFGCTHSDVFNTWSEFIVKKG